MTTHQALDSMYVLGLKHSLDIIAMTDKQHAIVELQRIIKREEGKQV